MPHSGRVFMCRDGCLLSFVVPVRPVRRLTFAPGRPDFDGPDTQRPPAAWVFWICCSSFMCRALAASAIAFRLIDAATERVRRSPERVEAELSDMLGRCLVQSDSSHSKKHTSGIIPSS